MRPVVDLFCGCGGFSHGASLAGSRIILAIDNWREALEVHQQNHSDCEHLLLELGGELHETAQLIRSHLKDITQWHLHASPPCQSLSIANQHTNNSEEGMRLVNWYLALVEILQPTSWSMEQVSTSKRYLRDQHEHSVEKVDARDYGLAQMRRRLFIGRGWTLKPTITVPKSVKMFFLC